MKNSLNWAILGTGWIAGEMAEAFQKMGKSIYAVGSRTYEKTLNFAAKYGISKVYQNPDDMFEDEAVDIVYVATPHNTHFPYIRKALQSGKHVLAEKAITLNSVELGEVVSLAEGKNLVLAEAMTIWHMPLYRELHRILDSGELGKVLLITVNHGSVKEYDLNNRFFSRKLAGGTMLDMGVYALSLVRGFQSETPSDIYSQWKAAPTGVDMQATVLLNNAPGEMASIALSMNCKQPKRAMISCEKGYIEIMEYPRSDKAVIVDAETGERKEICAGDTEEALCYEVTDMENAVLTGNAAEMKLRYSTDVMNIMTRLRNEWGLRYPEEENK